MTIRIEGYAIVSADGMLADSRGVMPPQLINEADQRFFERGLDQAAAVVHGRRSQEHQANSPHRRRLVVTRGVGALAPHPKNDKALHWNPAGASFEEACGALGINDGVVAIIGGTDIFEMFLPRYDAFHLTRAARARLPGGRPVFPQVPARTPEDVLAEHELSPGPARVLDDKAGMSLTTWERKKPVAR
jgi:dihydrofolate reductase